MSKKQDILDAALKIFAEVGVSNASTKSIAIAANVSEALIFRHFRSKDNLVEEIVKSEYKAATKLASEHLEYKTAESFISNLFELPKILVVANKNFWQMQYKLLPVNGMAMTQHQLFMKSHRELLVKAFTELGYAEPALEAELLLLIIEGLWKCNVMHEFNKNHTEAIIVLAKKKYALTS